MAQSQIEQALRDLPRIGTRVPERDGAPGPAGSAPATARNGAAVAATDVVEAWRFEVAGNRLRLHFHPAAEGLVARLRRRLRGSPALAEFTRLQWLQRAGVAAPRARAVLMGYQLGERRGDAVLLDDLDVGAVPLDRYLRDHRLRGSLPPDRRRLAASVVDLLRKLAKAGLGHADLHLSSFARLPDGSVVLTDAGNVSKGVLSLDQVLPLAAEAEPALDRADLLRAWRALGPGGPMPRRNAGGPAVWRARLRRALGDARFCGRLAGDGWSGTFFRKAELPQPWSPASQLVVSDADWRDAWPKLLADVEADRLEVLKRGPSGDVLAGEVTLGGRAVRVVVKRPRRKFWYRYVNEVGRGSRSMRAWRGAWRLVARETPTAWPLLIMERRTLGYVTDALFVLERIEGHALSWPGWRAELGETAYLDLLRRAGRTLRKLESTGLYLFDAKADNFVVHQDPATGPVPVIIDTDGLRFFNRSGGIRRLLRSLRENVELGLTEEEQRALLLGFAPAATPAQLERIARKAAPRRVVTHVAPPPSPPPPAGEGARG